ncbi:MAG: hypothetical protein ACLRJV_12220 [Eubacteriales bacterium]
MAFISAFSGHSDSPWSPHRLPFEAGAVLAINPPLIVDDILFAYADILKRCGENAEWLQVDEPYLVMDLTMGMLPFPASSNAAGTKG